MEEGAGCAERRFNDVIGKNKMLYAVRNQSPSTFENVLHRWPISAARSAPAAVIDGWTKARICESPSSAASYRDGVSDSGRASVSERHNARKELL
ncbi:hypothetical protein EVAR_39950_1 [Eumeta japonica]|uniref:Uncharacterized protein n=1 Tax=Eumeta variegata TaxID=151549 RepID=A0A4C1X0V9_EUMVA|nr:hypothetical protein EVAR_39950_1 [Eumeta japonica]